MSAFCICFSKIYVMFYGVMVLLKLEVEISSGNDKIMEFGKYGFYHHMGIFKNLFLGFLVFM